MTAKTPLYGIEYLVQGEPIKATRLALENNAKTIEAALASVPLAPPGSTDLAAALARIGTLEAARTVIQPLVLKNSFAAVSGYRAPNISKTDKAVTVFALVTNGIGAGGVAFTLPVGWRPGGDLFFGIMAQSGGGNSIVSVVARAANGNVELYGVPTQLQAVMFTFTAEQ